MIGRKARVGRHLPASGGLQRVLVRARELECETVQLFVSNPQGWAIPPPRADAEAFAEGTRKLGLSPVVAHAKYLINLASPKSELRERSVRALAGELVAAGRIGTDLVVVHAGSHGGDGEKRGTERLVSGLYAARELAAGQAGHPTPAEPVVENSVGAGTGLCSTFEALAGVARRADVRVCVDTAHAFVAGYNLSTTEDARRVGAELRSRFGAALALLHLNDAKNDLGSHRDGHRRIGEGRIPQESWPAFFAALDAVPVVMETPYGDPGVDADQIRLIKKLAGGLPIVAEGL